jgi:two-component system, cell cycle sensor histidine kinase and response regulator CckA
MIKRKILIVEDEAILALDLKAQLEAMGYRVVGVVASGEMALREAGRHRPDLILMDVKINGSMDGVETARILKTRMDIPILYCSAYSDQELLKRAKVTKPFAYLIKPVNKRELAANIEMALSSHLIDQKLKLSEAWLSSVLSSIGDAVTTIDEHGMIGYMNPVSERMSGWKASEARGKSIQSVFPLFDEMTGKPILISPPDSASESTTAAIPRKSLLQLTDGRIISVDGNVSVLKDHLGNTTGATLTLRDITEYRKMETRIQNLERFQIFSQIASGVAHEVRNPLNAIMAVTEAMVQDLGPNPISDEYLGHIRTQVHRLSTLMRDLLDLGKPIQSSSMRKESIGTICDLGILLWKQFAPKSGSEVVFELKKEDEPLTVIANTDKLQQVIFNLLENAAGHSPADSPIEVSVFRAADGRIRVRLKDRGCGIPEEYLGSVFDPFFTTTKNGIGLGLSIVKNIVEQHDGRITLKNNDPPPGCTAEIDLPEAERKT